jgi:hypothetical protein
MTTPQRHGLASSLLSSRAMCACLAGAAMLHVGLEIAGLGGWPCPVRSATGVSCPGCGLGRACAALFRGEWREALRLHAFAPVAVLAMTICVLAACLDDSTRARWAERVDQVEKRLPVAAIILGALLVYWLLRLVLDATGTAR